MDYGNFTGATRAKRSIARGEGGEVIKGLVGAFRRDLARLMMVVLAGPALR